jgi:hypothetical protein
MHTGPFTGRWQKLSLDRRKISLPKFTFIFPCSHQEIALFRHGRQFGEGQRQNLEKANEKVYGKGEVLRFYDGQPAAGTEEEVPVPK